MRSLASVALLIPALAYAGELPYFSVLSDDTGSWPRVFSAVGFQQQPAGLARIFVARAGASASTEWPGRVENGAVLVLEGDSSLAESFGFRKGPDFVRVNSLTDVHRPKLSVVWEQGLELPLYTMPAGARVFARERWTGAPVMAGFRRGTGAVLWVAVSPGERGYERFPYLLQALSDLGMEAPFRSNRLWAFFDSAYRSRVDLDYFAARWRKSGVATLHVAAWHFFESDPEQDAYLRKLIEACHREGILVYAWLELPHVSEKFWNDHPAWREKTALLQDAHLDWRKLMNLANRECFREVSADLRQMMGRFDWDGVNLAELYFESLEGAANPSRFTPMNDEVRARFIRERGFDPIEVFGARRDDASLRAFLDFRSALAREMQEEWLAELEKIRKTRTELDLVLTHVDDRYDGGMRDAIGADAARVLPLLEKQNFTFLVEDPATVWHLGSERYEAIAAQYRQLTPRRDRLAIDVNIADRYQDVYPTKQQTGTELFQLVHSAAANFQRVALYFEKSILPPDVALLASAASPVKRIERLGPKTVVESPVPFGLAWRGGALVDGQPWPAASEDTVWLPAGSHSVETAAGGSGARLIHLNADIKAGRIVDESTLEFSYQSATRAIAIFSHPVLRVEVDGQEEPPLLAGPVTLFLPRGQHLVTVRLQ